MSERETSNDLNVYKPYSLPATPYTLGECGCSALNWRDRYREDCYFYHEDRDMGGVIPTCKLDRRFGECPCDRCMRYVGKSEVFGIAKRIAEQRQTDAESGERK